MSIEGFEPVRHKLWEDAAALTTAALILSLGVALLSKAELATGGAAGLALVVAYATGFDFGLTFFFINLPFYILSAARMGWAATARTFAAVGLFALLSKLTLGWIAFERLDPIYAAFAGGTLLGVGMLILFRHRTSLGGVNLLALYAQEKYGWRAGYVQMALDGLILIVAFVVVGQARALASLLAAVVVNLVLATNHKPGRYMGMS